MNALKSRTPAELAAKRKKRCEVVGTQYEPKTPKGGLKSKPPLKAKKPKPRKSKCPSVTQLDRLFADYIKRFGDCAFANYGGVRCSNQLQCSHIKSRQYHSIRWDALNALPACSGHHLWLHSHPDAGYRATLEIVGEAHLMELQDRYNTRKKPTPDEKRSIFAWLKSEMAAHLGRAE